MKVTRWLLAATVVVGSVCLGGAVTWHSYLRPQIVVRDASSNPSFVVSPEYEDRIKPALDYFATERFIDDLKTSCEQFEELASTLSTSNVIVSFERPSESSITCSYECPIYSISYFDFDSFSMVYGGEHPKLGKEVVALNREVEERVVKLIMSTLDRVEPDEI